jgi:hypothetical protein
MALPPIDNSSWAERNLVRNLSKTYFLSRILNDKRPRYLGKINTVKQKKKLDFFQLFENLEIYDD